MMAGEQRIRLTRKQLADFLPDNESIRQFENLFDSINTVVDSTTTDDPYGAIGESTSAIQEANSHADSLIIQLIDRVPQPIQTSDNELWGPMAQAHQPQPSDGELWGNQRQGAWIDQSNPVLSKMSGRGIKVDIVNPTFPWADIIGLMEEDPGGANSPVLLAFRGGLVRNFAYTTNDKVDLRFHIPHDYAPGTDMFVHVHWSHNGTAINGNFVLSCASTYAKGHNQAAFPAEKTITITYATVNIATTPQYQHRIDEVQWSSSGGSATLFDSAQIEPDGLVLMNCTLTGLPTVTGGTTPRVFIEFIDLHYQSTGIYTKQKSPDFYV